MGPLRPVSRRGPRRCCSCRSRTASPASSRSARSRPAACSATARHGGPARGPGVATSRRSSSPYRASSRRSTTRRAEGPSPRARARSSDGPRGSRSPTAEALDYPGGPGLGLRAQHAVFDRLVYGKLRAALGGKAARAISGGAALGAAARPLLPRRRRRHPRGLRADRDHRGRVREPARPAEDRHRRPAGARRRGKDRRRRRDPGQGQVIFPGVLAQRGGHHGGDHRTAGTTPATSAARRRGLPDITGRKKEIIVTAGGKNVAPAVLEDRMRGHALISQWMVVGDGRPFIGALMTSTPRRSALEGAAGSPRPDCRGPARRPGPARRGPGRDRRREQGGQPRGGDQEVPHRRRFDRGAGTPVRQVGIKRTVLAKEFAAEIEALYAQLLIERARRRAARGPSASRGRPTARPCRPSPSRTAGSLSRGSAASESAPVSRPPTT